MAKKNYIVLEKKDGDARDIKGYIRIGEMGSNVSFETLLQGFSDVDNKIVESLLIDTVKKEIINLGKVNFDKKGNGKAVMDRRSSNLNGNYDVAVIAIRDKDGYSYPLEGYTTRVRGEYMHILKEKYETNDNNDDFFKTLVDILEVSPEKEEVKKDNAVDVLKEILEEEPKNQEPEEKMERRKIITHGDYIESVLDEYEEFDNILPIDDTTFYKINSPKRCKYMPYLGYAMTLRDCNMYNEHIFGITKEHGLHKHYVYGVKTRGHAISQPMNGKTGFIYFFPTSRTEGYWIMIIDATSGEVIAPYRCKPL